MKKFTIALLLLVVLSVGALATNDISVLINGKTTNFDVPPVIENGRTLVPLRAIFEALGADVEWLNDTREIVSQFQGKEIRLQINNKQANNKGVMTTLDVPPQIKNGRTLVPLRFIAESLDKDVEWIADTRTITINDENIEINIEKILSEPNRINTKYDQGYIRYSKYPDPKNLKELKENAENLPIIGTGKATPVSNIIYAYEGNTSKFESAAAFENVVLEDKAKITKVFDNGLMLRFTSNIFENNKEKEISKTGFLVKDGVATNIFMTDKEGVSSVPSVDLKKADYIAFPARYDYSSIGYLFVKNNLKDETVLDNVSNLPETLEFGKYTDDENNYLYIKNYKNYFTYGYDYSFKTTCTNRTDLNSFKVLRSDGEVITKRKDEWKSFNGASGEEDNTRSLYQLRFKDSRYTFIDPYALKDNVKDGEVLEFEVQARYNPTGEVKTYYTQWVW